MNVWGGGGRGGEGEGGGERVGAERVDDPQPHIKKILGVIFRRKISTDLVGVRIVRKSSLPRQSLKERISMPGDSPVIARLRGGLAWQGVTATSNQHYLVQQTNEGRYALCLCCDRMVFQ